MVTCPACNTTKPKPFGDVKVLDKDGDIMKVIVRFTGHACCDSETDEYFKKITAVYDKKKKFQILYDTTNITLPTKKQFYKQVDFMQKKDQLTTDYVHKAAIVSPLSAVKAMLKVLFKFKPAACDTKVCDNLSQAHEYLIN